MSYRKTREASTVSYNSGGATGATVTTVEDHLVRVLNVKDFGAVGDAVTDDTTAIQNALNALVPGDVLEFPAGRYIVSSTMTLAVGGVTLRGSNTTFQGGGNDGPVAHIILNTASTTAFSVQTFQGTSTYIRWNNTGTSTYTASDVSPTEIIFDGLIIHNQTGGLSNNVTGIDLTGLSDIAVTIKNCMFKWLNSGVIAPTGSLDTSLIVRDCYFTYCDIVAIALSDIDTFVHRNHFQQAGPIKYQKSTGSGGNIEITNNSWSLGLASAVIFDTSSGAQLSSVRISNNRVNNLSGDCEFILQDIVGLVISDNVINGNALFTIDIDCNIATVTGNYLTASGSGNTIFEIAGDNFVIANNIMSSADGVNLIDIAATAKNTRVVSNQFLDISGDLVAIGTAVTDAGTNSIIENFGPTGETGATGSTGSTGETGMTGNIPDEQIDILILVPVNRKYTVSLNAKFATNVVNMTHRLDAGTLEASLEIDGVSIGGLDDLPVSTAEVTDGATGANEIVIGQELVLSLTGEVGSDTFVATIKTERP